MNLIRILQILVCVAGISLGQVFMKLAAMNLHNPASGIAVGPIYVSWHFPVGIILLGLSTLLWVWILRLMPLNIAYPFMALAFVLVPLLCYFLLSEPLAWKNLYGTVLIVAGVIIVSR
jgi:drug/metabolite transporter (DMT)-like permease